MLLQRTNLRKTVFQDLRYFGNLVPRLCLGGNLDLNKRFDAWGKFLIMKSRQWSGGDLTVFEGLAVGLFDHLNCQHTGEFNQDLSKKVRFPGVCAGASAVLLLTGTLCLRCDAG